MIKSMTGFGIATTDTPQAKYTVEIKSLNSKFLELNLRLPKAFSSKELFIRNECAKRIERGKVSLVITVDYLEQTAKAATINEDLFKHYYTQLKKLAETLGDQTDRVFTHVLTLPEVITYADDEADEKAWQVLLDTFEKAMKQFQLFRTDEGTVLKIDLLQRNLNITNLLTEVTSSDKGRVMQIKERLQQHLEEGVGINKIDHNRFEQELIYYLDKLDITEEKVRLKSHCDYFKQVIEEEPNGKKLGFISQEMGREINTLGSKANDAQIQRIVVQMKEELEKIKEQLLNIL